MRIPRPDEAEDDLARAIERVQARSAIFDKMLDMEGLIEQRDAEIEKGDDSARRQNKRYRYVKERRTLEEVIEETTAAQVDAELERAGDMHEPTNVSAPSKANFYCTDGRT